MEVGGVQIAPTAELTVNGPALTLNDAGMCKKLFVSVYVGALYLPRKAARGQKSGATQSEVPYRFRDSFDCRPN